MTHLKEDPTKNQLQKNEKKKNRNILKSNQEREDMKIKILEQIKKSTSQIKNEQNLI